MLGIECLLELWWTCSLACAGLVDWAHRIQVVLAGNEMPTINDMTYQDLLSVIQQVRDLRLPPSRPQFPISLRT